MNIIIYNVFGSGGPNLYGVEPFSYYINNCLINLNIIFVLGMIVPPLFMIQTAPYVSLFKMLLYYCPLYLWLLIMFTRPHKVLFIFLILFFILFIGRKILIYCISFVY